jgi:hypothetical protein
MSWPATDVESVIVIAGVWEATEGWGECELLFNIMAGESTVKYLDFPVEAMEGKFSELIGSRHFCP